MVEIIRVSMHEKMKMAAGRLREEPGGYAWIVKSEKHVNYPSGKRVSGVVGIIPDDAGDPIYNNTDIMRVIENAPVVGKSLAQIELRKKYGVTVLAIGRDSQILSNPYGDMQFCADDDLFVLGLPEKIALVTGLFYNPKEREVD